MDITDRVTVCDCPKKTESAAGFFLKKFIRWGCTGEATSRTVGCGESTVVSCKFFRPLGGKSCPSKINRIRIRHSSTSKSRRGDDGRFYLVPTSAATSSSRAVRYSKSSHRLITASS